MPVAAAARSFLGIALLVVLAGRAVSPSPRVRTPEARSEVSQALRCVDRNDPGHGHAAAPARTTGVFGWLQRHVIVRVMDSGDGRLPGFLRSPLLGSLPGPEHGDCAPATAFVSDTPSAHLPAAFRA